MSAPIPSFERVPLSEAAWEGLRTASTATLSSELLRLGIRGTFLTGVMPLRPELRMAGFAFTLRYVPARDDLGVAVDYDNDTNVQRLAIEALGPGDVLVIDARGERRAASLGHILATRARARGAEGIVTDGALRDTPALAALNLPTYCAAAHAETSAVLHHPVDANIPIACAGALVIPGDVVVGDAEGVIIIPATHAESVAVAGLERERLERYLQEQVEAGASIRGTYPPDATTLEAYRRQDRGGPNGAPANL